MAEKRVCDTCGETAKPEDQECSVCEGILNVAEPISLEKKEKKPKK